MAGSHGRDRQTLTDVSGTVALIGAGRMGGAMLEGWLGLGLDPKNIVVFEPQPAEEITALAARGVGLNPAPDSLGELAALVIAVKPQVAADIVPAYASLATRATVTVSIMAGKTLSAIARLVPQTDAVVRAMPNTPAAVGRGITVAVANGAVSAAQRTLADALLSATGGLEWVADEGLMDAVTAVSGSGPAYVFLLVEALSQAGIAAGLAPDLAMKLARATVAGSGELLHRSSLDAATLRQNVTSPGGTTAAALKVLMAPDGLQPALSRAVAAAVKRSRELAG